MWTKEELDRYHRQMILPGVGPEGQERLKGSSVVVVGAGGLGVPVLQYLVAAGVGRVGLVEMDRVELSNLHRQVLYTTEDVGRPKALVAKERLLALNPGVRIDAYPVHLTAANALEILGPYDLLVDASDNFPTRYLVNDAAVLLGKPLVYGAIHQFEGQVAVFHHPTEEGGRGPCYRCLFPRPPAPGAVPSCAEAGVFGVLPGTVGALMAAEALKLLLGIGKPLAGYLLLYEALEATFRKVRVRRNPACPVCGENPTQRELIDYEAFCGLGRE
uniref:Molybdopterin-synthase adenylyltransferase MoeB n=2 Tax=Thermus islandicus TaxID=540988 RepID=A0A7C2FV44_9DEIN